MKIAFWGKGKNLDKAIEEVLTAENAQKIADVALERNTARLGQMAYESALQFIREAAGRAEYSIYYSFYTCGSIASELRADELTTTQARGIESFVYNKLTELGYYVELSYYGPKRMITISWKKV
jgi:hypothetical protein